MGILDKARQIVETSDEKAFEAVKAVVASEMGDDIVKELQFRGLSGGDNRGSVSHPDLNLSIDFRVFGDMVSFTVSGESRSGRLSKNLYHGRSFARAVAAAGQKV